MNTLKISSSGRHDLKAVIETALQNEMKLMEVGIRKTEKRIEAFEGKYRKDTASFLHDFENDRLEETMDFMEWVGESRMLKRLRDKQETLRSIRFEN